MPQHFSIIAQFVDQSVYEIIKKERKKRLHEFLIHFDTHAITCMQVDFFPMSKL